MERQQFLGEVAENSRLDKRAREAGCGVPTEKPRRPSKNPDFSPANKRSRVERHVTMGGVCQRLPDGVVISLRFIKQGLGRLRSLHVAMRWERLCE